MRDCNQGRMRQQVSFLRRQFLQEGELPFTNVLSQATIAPALQQQTELLGYFNDGKRRVLKETPRQPFRIHGIEFKPGTVDGTAAASLPGASVIDHLHWRELKHADQAAAWIGKHSTLKILSLDHSDISDAGLVHLSQLTSLERLQLSGCDRISGRGLVSLTQLQNLWSLTMYHSSVDDNGLDQIGKFQSLTDLNVTACPQFTTAGLRHLAGLPHLRSLYLGENPQVTDATIASLAKFKSLRVLWLHNTGVTAEGVAKLRAALPDCFIAHESLQSR